METHIIILNRLIFGIEKKKEFDKQEDSLKMNGITLTVVHSKLYRT